MKSSQLQSLSRRVKNAIAAIHVEINLEAMTLTGNDEFDRPTYGQLSRLQRERKKLEELQLGLKNDLKAAFREENAIRVLAAHGFFKDPRDTLLVTDMRRIDHMEV